VALGVERLEVCRLTGAEPPVGDEQIVRDGRRVEDCSAAVEERDRCDAVGGDALQAARDRDRLHVCGREVVRVQIAQNALLVRLLHVVDGEAELPVRIPGRVEADPVQRPEQLHGGADTHVGERLVELVLARQHLARRDGRALVRDAEQIAEAAGERGGGDGDGQCDRQGDTSARDAKRLRQADGAFARNRVGRREAGDDVVRAHRVTPSGSGRKDTAASSRDASRDLARWYRTRPATAEQPRTTEASRSESPSHATSRSTSRSRSLSAANAAASAPSPRGSGSPPTAARGGAWRASFRRWFAIVFRATAYSHGKGSSGTRSSFRQHTRNVSETTSSTASSATRRRTYARTASCCSA